MEYIKKKDFAKLKGKNVTIKKIYGPYRMGWNENMKRYEFVEKGSDKISIWDKGKKKEIDGNVDWKIHKKKYDIIISLEKDIKLRVEKYNKEIGESVEEVIVSDVFTVKELSSKIIGDMMACSVAFGKVPEDSEGNRQFDWEESFLSELEGVTLVFDTEKKDRSINGKQGKYDDFTFKEAILKKQEVEDDDTLPF